MVDGVFHTSADALEVTGIYARFHAVLGELVAVITGGARRRADRVLIAAREEELLDTLMPMISAGHETTVDRPVRAVPRPHPRRTVGRAAAGDSFISHGHRSLPALTG